MKSTCVSTSQRIRPDTPALYQAARGVARLVHEVEPRVRLVPAAGLGRRVAVGEHDVRGEVVRAADERGADAVRVDGHAVALELADLGHVEAARDDDPHAL